MNRTRLLFIGVLALALGGLLSSFVYRTLQARTTAGSPSGVDVVVASDDLQVGAKVEDQNVKLVKLPADALPGNIFHLKSSVVGRGVVLPIAKGEFLLPSKLAAPNAGAGMPALIPPGMRAVSVHVNEVVGVAGFVVPGTRVDVLLTGNPAGSTEAQTTTPLENVAVLASGQRLERNAAGQPQTTPVITLLVTPEDAQKLTLASSEGRIQLSLRNPLDTHQEKIPAVRNQSLYYGGGPPPVPPTNKTSKVKQAPKTQTLPQKTDAYTITVIRGTEKKEIQFDH